MANDDPNAEAWRRNLKGKSEEIRNSIQAVLARLYTASSQRQEFQTACSALEDRTAAMELMYATSSRPSLLHEIKSKARTWPQCPSNIDLIVWMVDARRKLVEVGDGKKFDDPLGVILSKYANDNELNAYLDDLCIQLKSLLEQGQDELVSSITKELRKILEEIETLQGKSLIEIDPYLEFLITTLGTIAVAIVSDSPLWPVISNALVLTIRSRRRLVKLYEEARKTLLKDRGFSHAKPIAINLSEFDCIENEEQATESLRRLSQNMKTLPRGSEGAALE